MSLHRFIHCIGIRGIRLLAYLATGLLCVVDLTAAQTAQPRVRPALIGSGPKALINLIDTNKLMEKGQGNRVLNFQCVVSTSGDPLNAVTYRATPGSEALDKAVNLAFARCRFIPAICDGKACEVLFLGTVLFAVADGGPPFTHLCESEPRRHRKRKRFYCPAADSGNQEEDITYPRRTRKGENSPQARRGRTFNDSRCKWESKTD